MAGIALPTVPTKIPHNLARAPLVEAIFEFRFTPAQSSVAQLLPGLIFSKLSGKYDRSEATPVASIPPEIRAKHSDLRYQAQHRLSGERASVFIGDRVAGVSITRPYEGWRRFRPRILEFLEVLQTSKLVERGERFSIKFVNIIPSAPGQQLALLNLRLEVGGIGAPENGFRFRTEINDETYIRIIQIVTNAETDISSQEKISGLLLSLDCIRVLRNEDFWQEHPSGIDQVHDQLKHLFFGLITEKTLESLEPSYD